MSQLAKPGRADQERDLQTPRPVQHQSSQEESASPSPSGRDSESLRDQRKSISSLSTHSVVSFSSDDHSEVGELPAESGGTGDVRVRTERQSSGHSGNVPADKNGDASDGDLGAMEKQLEDLKVESDSRADNNVDQEEEDEDSYLNDPLVKYTLQLHDYTKRLYIEARIAHEKLQKERNRGGKAGRSGIEAMGRKTATTSRY